MDRKNIVKLFQATASLSVGLYAYLYLTKPANALKATAR